MAAYIVYSTLDDAIRIPYLVYTLKVAGLSQKTEFTFRNQVEQ